MPSATKKAWGIWTVIPEPSPVFPSAFSAPRCSMFARILSPDSTMPWLFLPSMLTAIPTPQESFSYSGSYRPALCTLSLS